ncbi:ABC transporter permease [Hoeflea prorocentri]|uniref:ABC transporter permease subunit n=1 Tax=Hoeflea prorocentri TaxID=1922333 RepID=A0A9X3UHK4_9HYPH|nr:ABC transporter permease subunit [Hoeflea prorocentri]MCY6379368.1 ABC transporter permease subunit [Hoeflea prorocentri]MDA5397169.1 ABC transporter permease subunit [Hoeflea prorocentri]
MDYFELMGFGAGGWGPLMLKAAGMTVSIAVAGFTVGIFFGIIGAALKLSRDPVAMTIAETYTTIFRGIPELLIIYLFYFGGSLAFSNFLHLFGYQGFFSIPSFVIGSIAIGTVSGAYQTEVYRSAFLAIDRGQIEAARACGMKGFLILRRIIAPQVLRIALPGLGNVWQSALKETTLLSVTGLVELLRQASVGAGSTREPFAFYLTAGAIFLVITSISGWGFEKMEKHFSRSVRK